MGDPVRPEEGAEGVVASGQVPGERGLDEGPAAVSGRMLLRVVVGGGEVALPSEEIVEVLGASPIARVPGAPAEVAGIVNRRGTMTTVVDLGEALGLEPAAADPEHRVVVVRFAGREVGIAVSDVLRIVGEEEAGAAAGGRRPLRVVEIEPLLGPVFRSAE